MAERQSRVRAIYLYVAALLGLVLLTVGAVRLVDLGLRSWVFTEADREADLHFFQPPLPVAIERIERIERAPDGAALSEQERAALRQWLADYQQWQQRTATIDPARSRRQRSAASSLALILIGLPLYLYHWGLIRREAKRGA